eukprot:scpid55402/ scgid28691/ 
MNSKSLPRQQSSSSSLGRSYLMTTKVAATVELVVQPSDGDVEAAHRLSDVDGSKLQAFETSDLRSVLACAPSPQSHRCVRYCFALALGAGLRRGRAYPLSLLILLFMVFGLAVWIHVAAWSCSQVWSQRQGKHWLRSTLAYLLLWVAKGCAELAYVWATVCAVIYIHHRGFNYDPFSNTFTTSSARLTAIDCAIRPHRQQRRLRARLHALWPDALALLSVFFSVALAWDYIERHHLTITHFPPGKMSTVWMVVFYTQQVWLVFASVAAFAVFAALCEDTVIVIRSNSKRLMHRIAQTASSVRTEEGVSSPCQNRIAPRVMIESLMVLQQCIDFSMCLPLRWFAGNVVLCVLTMLFYVAGQILYVLAGEKELEGGDYVFVALIMLLGIMATFFAPMYSASRVTSTMEELRGDLQENIEFARSFSTSKYTCLLTFFSSPFGADCIFSVPR